jgi:hypothetical protein
MTLSSPAPPCCRSCGGGRERVLVPSAAATRAARAGSWALTG